jgi:metal-responsive CopG/Arc/MetJ family transcriptional regulator
MATPDRVRLQFDASPKLIDSLDRIAEALDCATRTEAIRAAIRLLYKLVDVAAQDGFVTVLRKDGTMERWVL